MPEIVVHKPVSKGMWIMVAGMFVVSLGLNLLGDEKGWRAAINGLSGFILGLCTAITGLFLFFHEAAKAGGVLQEEIPVFCPGCGDEHKALKVSVILPLSDDHGAE